MSRYISSDIRSRVVKRADCLCEYCLIHESDTFLGCEVDHIISVKHGGGNSADNLAYACFSCNRSKGSDIGSVFWGTSKLTRFFNPRKDQWSRHFCLKGSVIRSLTEIGDVTARILKFNETERILERETLIGLGRYPSLAAQTRINQ